MALGLSKAELTTRLVRIQRTLCVYDTMILRNGDKEEPKAPLTCDCKYGCSKPAGGSETGNGCPEMRDVVGLLQGMTKAEFTRIVGRIQRKRAAAFNKMMKEYRRKEAAKGRK